MYEALLWRCAAVLSLWKKRKIPGAKEFSFVHWILKDAKCVAVPVFRNSTGSKRDRNWHA